MKPLSDRVLVQLDPKEEVTPGGIVLPDTAQDSAHSGTVLEIGYAVAEIKEGNRVFVGRYAGVSLNHNGHDCLLLKEEDILAFVDQEEKDG